MNEIKDPKSQISNFLIRPDFVGQPQRGDMFIDWAYRKLSQPQRGGICMLICRSFGACEIFSCQSYKHSALLALARCPTHKIRPDQQISNLYGG
jgi:hypothetical protein